MPEQVKDLTINLREILLGRAVRLRYIVRYSICPRNHDESVAEHSFYTAFYAMMLCRDIEGVDTAKVLSRALMHDMDESYSGDFIRMFKHSSPELKRVIDEACSNFMTKFVTETTKDEGPDLLSLWTEAKDDSKEGAIVSFADFLSVVSYVVTEIEGGNQSMCEHLKDLVEFFRTFHGPRYYFLKKYIDQCQVILAQVTMKQIKWMV